MVYYEHTQPGTLLRSILGGLALTAAVIALVLSRVELAFALIPLLVALILAVTLVLFHSMKVTVTQDEIVVSFGFAIHIRFDVHEVANATLARNRWYYGWGIKYTPYGWQFNVSGYDLVQLELKNGRRYRIGTDEPAKLLSAITSATGSSR